MLLKDREKKTEYLLTYLPTLQIKLHLRNDLYLLLVFTYCMNVQGRSVSLCATLIYVGLIDEALIS